MKYVTRHIPLMAYLHAVLLFITFTITYTWFTHLEHTNKVTAIHKMLHDLESYEEEEQWHEDLDILNFEV